MNAGRHESRRSWSAMSIGSANNIGELIRELNHRRHEALD